jgi:hypothetical protein
MSGKPADSASKCRRRVWCRCPAEPDGPRESLTGMQLNAEGEAPDL